MHRSLQTDRSGPLDRLWQRHSQMLSIVLLVLGLILVDQLTKIVAYSAIPSARSMLDQPGFNFGLAWLIHEPNAYSHFQALLVCAIIGFAWTLPIPTFCKIMWAAAGISNHVEMLARPGTVDFLAMRIGNMMWVANVADIYYVLGTLTLMVWVANRVRTAKSWLEPVTA